MSGEAFGLGPDLTDEYDIVIITGWPVNFDALPEEQREIFLQIRKDLGIAPTHYPGSMVMPCNNCGMELFVGPKSHAQYMHAPSKYLVLCMFDVAGASFLMGGVDLKCLGNTNARRRTDL